MTTALNRKLQPDHRRAPRALVCASAEVLSKEEPATEHMVYDLSTGGIRLCGLPRAQVGDEVRVRLQLPGVRIRASGQLVRFGSTSESADFAIQFADLEPRDQQAIQDAVVEAFAHPDRHALLLVQRDEERCWPECFDWLSPLLPICAMARTSIETAQCLEKDHIEIGILGPPGDGAQAINWNEAHPEVCWRSIDHAGRLADLRRRRGLGRGKEHVAAARPPFGEAAAKAVDRLELREKVRGRDRSALLREHPGLRPFREMAPGQQCPAERLGPRGLTAIPDDASRLLCLRAR